MARKNRNKKEVPIEGITTAKDKNKGSIFVNLPVPKSDVLGKLVNDALIYRYIESVEK